MSLKYDSFMPLKVSIYLKKITPTLNRQYKGVKPTV